ncbi:hypothetical protein PVAND_014290 [Polypedilum vanderplanki]|uniref:Uncharacterized protein n=1 Tax=Polypedilum vanderplanki TaxID=319348 RepID=A0A9J6CSA6_POLVA|nr:hypothetical protein PVAND_014290 [Polypedilum vanderplanki]
MLKKVENDLVMLGNSNFKWQESVKYLGVILDRKLLFKEHIDRSIAIANGVTFSSFYCLFKKNNSLDSAEKVFLYKVYVRPILTYACQIFNNCAKTHLKKIQVFQNKILRLCYNTNWDDFISNETLHSRAELPLIRDFVDKLVNRFYNICQTHDNVLISSLAIYNNNLFTTRFKYRLPIAI